MRDKCLEDEIRMTSMELLNVLGGGVWTLLNRHSKAFIQGVTDCMIT